MAQQDQVRGGDTAEQVRGGDTAGQVTPGAGTGGWRAVPLLSQCSQALQTGERGSSDCCVQVRALGKGPKFCNYPSTTPQAETELRLHHLEPAQHTNTALSRAEQSGRAPQSPPGSCLPPRVCCGQDGAPNQKPTLNQPVTTSERLCNAALCFLKRKSQLHKKSLGLRGLLHLHRIPKGNRNCPC